MIRKSAFCLIRPLRGLHLCAPAHSSLGRRTADPQECKSDLDAKRDMSRFYRNTVRMGLPLGDLAPQNTPKPAGMSFALLGRHTNEIYVRHRAEIGCLPANYVCFGGVT